MNQQIKQRIEQINNGQVPEGYKKTEFGIFPSDWVTGKKLKDIGSFDKGRGLPGDKMCDSGVPCVGYGDIYMKYNNFHFEKAENFVDEDTASESLPIKKGTLLFTGTGETAEEIGKCVCYNGDETIYAGGDIITFKTNEVNPLFLAYQQYQSYSLAKKASFGQGHSVVHIHADNLEKLNVAYPKSTAEQEKIAKILMKWDKAIELQEKYIEKANQQRIFLLKKVFEPKQNWSYQTLGDNVDLLASGGTPSTKILKYFDGYIVWVSIDDISQSGKYISKSNRTLSLEGLQNSSAKLFPKGTILYAMYASIGKCAIANIDCATSQAIIGIVPSKNSFDNQYLYYYLCSIQERISTQGQQGTQANLNKGLVESFKIPTPMKDGKIDIDEQKRISKILIAIDNTITLNTKKLESIKQQRKALQQYLLNGIVRVEV